MDVRMESTEGFGRQAEVWIAGNLLTVYDQFSSQRKPCPPGMLKDVKFAYKCDEGFTWEQVLRGNESRRKLLDPVRGSGYVGYGRIVSIMPVVVDFGLVEMEDARWTSDEQLVGRYVRVPIDQLEIHRAHEPDWPEHVR